MKRTRITIKDIANELNISASTVSRALQDHPALKKETKEAVRALAEKWNYQPNSMALNFYGRHLPLLLSLYPILQVIFFPLQQLVFKIYWFRHNTI